MPFYLLTAVFSDKRSGDWLMGVVREAIDKTVFIKKGESMKK
jgi:hypothetical protein